LRFPARIRDITAHDDLLDLAVLEVRNLPDDIEPLPLGSSPPPMLGDLLIIGHPFTGNPWTMDIGRVANIVADPTQQNLQIGGASLAAGNSGSPVIYNDEVVGLLVTIGDELGSAPPTGQGNSIGGFGFAYPLEIVQDQLHDWGIVRN
jgi:superkiller protein 3